MSLMQGDNPLQTTTEVLGPDAMRAADEDILTQLMAAPARKPRGRPPGSKNKPKTDETGSYIPPGKRASSGSATGEGQSEQAKVEAKQKLAKEYEKKILEFNTELMSWLVSNGIPAGLLFKNGQPPNQPITNSNWTDLAQQIAVPPHLAKMAGLTAAEIQSSTIGTSVFDTIQGDSPIRLVILIGGTLLVGIPYLRNLNEIRKRVAAMQEAAEQFNREQARAGAPPMQVVG
jgi:hypothetical protein